MTSRQVDVLILGAGAAGLLCAIEAGRRGRKVVLLDHADCPGKKILISGGGRCNFTNRHTLPENFLSNNRHFAKSALARYTPQDFVALVEQHGIAFHEKTLGQLFCDGTAQQIVTMLTRECREAGVSLVLGCTIHRVSKSSGYTVETSAGTWQAQSLVVATGGLSIPKMGATGFGHDLARQFGLALIPPRPALVPLVLPPQEQQLWCDLSGLSTEVVATTGGGRQQASFREKLLITHRGLSGPAALQISSYWKPGASIQLDLGPGRLFTSALRSPNAQRTPAAALQALRETLPARFAERWLTHHAPARWSNPGLDALEHQLHHWTVTPQDTEGYAKAEVTAGGVDTTELNARSMESTRNPGLFFIGEVVDVTGWLGGYNFQWAWASGAAAGRSA